MRRVLRFGVGRASLRSRASRWLTIIVSMVAVLGLAAPPAGCPRAAINVAPKSIDFGTKAVGTTYFDDVKITNASGKPLQFLVEAGLPDDFGFGLYRIDLPGADARSDAGTPGELPGRRTIHAERVLHRLAPNGLAHRHGDRSGNRRGHDLARPRERPGKIATTQRSVTTRHPGVDDMRCKRLGIMAVMSVLLATMAVSVPSAWAKPAHCDKKTGVCTPPSKLKWTSPPSIADGVPADLLVERYVSRCPSRRFGHCREARGGDLRTVQLRWRHGRCRAGRRRRQLDIREDVRCGRNP